MQTIITGTLTPLVLAMAKPKAKPALYPGPTLLKARTRTDDTALPVAVRTLLRKKG